MASVQQAPPIARGYPYALQVTVASDDDPFPAGCVVRAGVGTDVGGQLLGTLSTADGTVTRVDDHNVVLQLPETITAKLTSAIAVIDLARVDVGGEVWLGVQITLPVVSPVTAP